MPWQYPNNIPDSMKYLKPSIQKKAIAIANHVLDNTSDEGKAIAIGIAKAKKVHDKKIGLVKLAIILPIGGAILGSHFGKKIGKDKKSRDRNAKIGSLIGLVAGAGANIGLYKYMMKNQYRFRPGYSTPRPPKKPTTDIPSFFKEHGHNHSLIKTKAHAKKIHRDLVRKHHPDLGGDIETLKKINVNWEGVENSGWFNKLAAFHNTKFYRALVKAFKKNDDKFLAKKYENVIGKVEDFKL